MNQNKELLMLKDAEIAELGKRNAELEKENEKLTGQLNTATIKILEYEALLRAIRNDYLNEPSITYYKMQTVKKFINDALQDKKGGE